jgi:TrmH family RNA methyltransferase
MITSTSNHLIKSIRKLADKKYRALSGLALVEGTKLVLDAIEQQAVIDKLLISASFERSNKRFFVNSKIAERPIEPTLVSDQVFQSITLKENPQGIAAVVRQTWLDIDTFRDQFSGFWVALWEIADPGNLGSIMRTVDAVNANGIILVDNCTDPYDPGAIRASMGAIFSNKLVKCSLPEFIEWVEKSKITLIGTSDAANTYYRDVIFPDDLVLMMGSERQGMPGTLLKACKRVVGIPMNGISDSLNIAVATAIILYEVFDQKRKVKQP